MKTSTLYGNVPLLFILVLYVFSHLNINIKSIEELFETDSEENSIIETINCKNLEQRLAAALSVISYHFNAVSLSIVSYTLFDR